MTFPSDEDLLRLATLPVPPQVRQVAGCTCGGLDWHLQECGLFTMPPELAAEAVSAAHERLHDHTAELNRRLHAVLAADQADPGSST